MNPSNTEFSIVRNPSGRYTDTVGTFSREQLEGMRLRFKRTLRTSQGPMDEYELVNED